MSEQPHTRIIAAICKALDIEDIKINSRRPIYAYARFIAIQMMIDKGYSYCRVAHFLDRPLSTIYFGEMRFKALRREESFKRMIDKVNEEMEAQCA